MKWHQRYKLPISIAILIVLNITTVHFTKADIDKTVSGIKAAPQVETLTAESIKQAKFEKVLNNNPSAKKNLGYHIPKVAETAIMLCDSYKEQGITIPILMGIIEVESNFNYLAVGRAKDGFTPESYGLMQIKPGTAIPILNDLGYRWTTESLLKPNINMMVGTVHLLALHYQFMKIGIEGKNEFHVSLMSYNRGTKSVLNSMKNGTGVPLNYMAKVKIASRKWERAGF